MQTLVVTSVRLWQNETPAFTFHACVSVRDNWGENRRIWLHKACAGSSLVLNTPQPRIKSAALQARLAELKKQLEQQQYDAMVQDITRAVSAPISLHIASMASKSSHDFEWVVCRECLTSATLVSRSEKQKRKAREDLSATKPNYLSACM